MSKIAINSSSDAITSRHTLTNSQPWMLNVVPALSRNERWSDDDDTPNALPTNYLDDAHSHRVVVDLPRDRAKIVELELVKNRLIMLITASNPLGKEEYEYYSEIDLPPQARLERATVELNDCHLIVTFEKTRPTAVEQAIASFPWARNQQMSEQ